MFSAVRQQKIDRGVLIAAKMGIQATRQRDAAVSMTLLFRLTRHYRTVHFKASRLRQHFMEAKNFIQQFWIR